MRCFITDGSFMGIRHRYTFIENEGLSRRLESNSVR
jgi:hypothetical protein